MGVHVFKHLSNNSLYIPHFVSLFCYMLLLKFGLFRMHIVVTDCCDKAVKLTVNDHSLNQSYFAGQYRSRSFRIVERNTSSILHFKHRVIRATEN